MSQLIDAIDAAVEGISDDAAFAIGGAALFGGALAYRHYKRKKEEKLERIADTKAKEKNAKDWARYSAELRKVPKATDDDYNRIAKKLTKIVRDELSGNGFEKVKDEVIGYWDDSEYMVEAKAFSRKNLKQRFTASDIEDALEDGVTLILNSSQEVCCACHSYVYRIAERLETTDDNISYVGTGDGDEGSIYFSVYGAPPPSYSDINRR